MVPSSIPKTFPALLYRSLKKSLRAFVCSTLACSWLGLHAGKVYTPEEHTETAATHEHKGGRGRRRLQERIQDLQPTRTEESASSSRKKRVRLPVSDRHLPCRKPNPNHQIIESSNQHLRGSSTPTSAPAQTSPEAATPRCLSDQRPGGCLRRAPVPPPRAKEPQARAHHDATQPSRRYKGDTERDRKKERERERE